MSVPVGVIFSQGAGILIGKITVPTDKVAKEHVAGSGPSVC